MSKTGKFDKEKYRVWFFGACTSLAYFDELRGGILPESVDRSNLDLLGTTPRECRRSRRSPETLALLDGILASQTIEQIVSGDGEVGRTTRSRSITDPTYHRRQ